MIKNIMDANNDVSVGAKEIEILKEHFPACFHNGSFDIERLKEYIKDKVNVTEEGYELRFLGKNYARLLASLDTTTVIVPDEEHNNLPENKESKNIYISGDNLDALKHLLKSYAGSIKCIYIDPPYNTGSDDFVYTDSFNFTVEELASKLSISEEQAGRILDLTRRGSATHSAWLMFMLPRLLLARDMLSKDGVIFISIDDNEQSNLKLLCDDIFREENFVGNIIWQSRTSISNDDEISTNHNHTLVYSKNRETLSFGGDDIDESEYINPDNDPRGPWKLVPIDANHIGGETIYPITNPKTGVDYYPPNGRIWCYNQATLDSLMQDGRIKFGLSDDSAPKRKLFLKERKAKGDFKTISSILLDAGTTKFGTTEIMSLFNNNKVFDYPKPTTLIKRLLKYGFVKDESIVLDFFSGSGTSAHAIMQMNVEDENNIQYILVQIPELIKAGTPAAELGFKTIDEIGQARIKLAANKLRKENPMFHGDLGFKHFTLQEPTNQSIEKMERFEPHTMFGDKTLVDEFGVPTILTTWLVRDGYGLTPDVKTLNIAGYDYDIYYIDKHLYIINPNLSNEVVAALLDKYQSDPDFNPQNIVIYGYALSWSELQGLKDNLQIIRDGEKNMRINFDIRY